MGLAETRSSPETTRGLSRRRGLAGPRMASSGRRSPWERCPVCCSPCGDTTPFFNTLSPPYSDTSIARPWNVRESVMRLPRFAEDFGQPGWVYKSSWRTLQQSVTVGPIIGITLPHFPRDLVEPQFQIRLLVSRFRPHLIRKLLPSWNLRSCVITSIIVELLVQQRPPACPISWIDIAAGSVTMRPSQTR